MDRLAERAAGDEGLFRAAEGRARKSAVLKAGAVRIREGMRTALALTGRSGRLFEEGAAQGRLVHRWGGQ